VSRGTLVGKNPPEILSECMHMMPCGGECSLPGHTSAARLGLPRGSGDSWRELVDVAP
jgi:hypothetical protein